MAREYGERILYPANPRNGPGKETPSPEQKPGTGNSGHYYIDRDGTIEQWVENGRVAHHVRGYNPRSIGIELVNLGRYPDWFRSGRQQMTEAYPPVQLSALLQLIHHLQQDLPGLRWIAGHDDLDAGIVAAEDDTAIMIRRKLDPGPLFPWPEVLASCKLQRLAT